MMLTIIAVAAAVVVTSMFYIGIMWCFRKIADVHSDFPVPFAIRFVTLVLAVGLTFNGVQLVIQLLG